MNSTAAIRFADRHTTALLAKLRLDARRFDVVFHALAEAFDAGASSGDSAGRRAPATPTPVPEVTGAPAASQEP